MQHRYEVLPIGLWSSPEQAKLPDHAQVYAMVRPPYIPKPDIKDTLQLGPGVRIEHSATVADEYTILSIGATGVGSAGANNGPEAVDVALTRLGAYLNEGTTNPSWDPLT